MVEGRVAAHTLPTGVMVKFQGDCELCLLSRHNFFPLVLDVSEKCSALHTLPGKCMAQKRTGRSHYVNIFDQKLNSEEQAKNYGKQ